MPNYYAGIGSRETPVKVLQLMGSIAAFLETKHFILRSGAADGADTAFERAVVNNLNKEVYLPWYGFNDSTSPLFTSTDEAEVLAAQIHPAWDKCSQGAKKLHTRNVHQVLGMDCATPCKFIVCWTPKGEAVGGTATAIRLAQAHGIPVINIGLYTNHKHALIDILRMAEIPFTTWARKAVNGYECSSKGDKRLSAYTALVDGVSIEEHYQCGIKGYASIAEGKGNPPLDSTLTPEQAYKAYKHLWTRYFRQNSGLFHEVSLLGVEHTFTDMFASTDINQARAISEIVNEGLGHVVNMHHKTPYHVYCGRPSKFGNPYSVEEFGERKAIALFKEVFNAIVSTDAGASVIKQLQYKTLACWCKPKACHCDVIIDYLDTL